MLFYNKFSFIILSKRGKVSAADIFGVPSPKISEKGTRTKASPTSRYTAPNT